MDFLGLTVDQWLDVAIALLVTFLAIPISYWLLDLVGRRVAFWVVIRTPTSFDDRVLEAAQMPARWLLVILAAEATAARLDFLGTNARALLNDLFFLAYLCVGLWFAWRLTHRLFAWYGGEIAARTQTDLDEHLVPFFRRVALILIALIAIRILLSHFSVDVTGLVATLGIGSLAIALAAQAALEDTISGFLIMVDRPFRVGDRIELRDLNTWGEVEDIGLRSARIRTLDNRMVIVPNSVIGRNLVVNHSYPTAQIRQETTVGIAYGSDLDRAREVIAEAVRSAPGVLDEEPVEVLFIEFGDSALTLRVRWWIDSYRSYYEMVDRVNSALYKALKGTGIDIPFPQRDVHHRIDAAALRQAVRAVRDSEGHSN